MSAGAGDVHIIFLKLQCLIKADFPPPKSATVLTQVHCTRSYMAVPVQVHAGVNPLVPVHAVQRVTILRVGLL